MILLGVSIFRYDELRYQCFNIFGISGSIYGLGAILEEMIVKNLANSEKRFDIGFLIIQYFDRYSIEF